MARPVDYRKGRGSKGVHTEDEQVPIGKKAQGRNSDSNAQKNSPPNPGAVPPKGQGKHAAGHEGQKAKSRAR
jgi:hypothetical protein